MGCSTSAEASLPTGADAAKKKVAPTDSGAAGNRIAAVNPGSFKGDNATGTGTARRYVAAMAASIKEAANDKTSLEEYSLQKVKARLLLDWHSEYEAEPVRPAHEDGSYTVSERATLIQLKDIVSTDIMTRKTKIICTLGPACGSEEGIGNLIDAGLNIARLNFSHGDHESHYKMLQLFRETCSSKQKKRAVLLDTKGPEIRTAMLRDGKNIALEEGQDVILEAVGDKYTRFEGFKTDEETRIGISYSKLCESVVPGNKILMADGSLSIEVLEILSETELKGRAMNAKELGQRKNCNLPGVHVDLPVLMDKDIDDLQNFACKHKVDFVAASFVQSKDDVLFIRKTLDKAGGHDVKIISKIENMAGLENFDGILEATDGVMVARGDLGMEIPSEKVALAQKLLITKSNIAGKFVICATQMLESMIDNPLPTRAEMTDIANAVYDGADAVMLSGETANGSFPDKAVATMADITANAEVGVDYYKQFNFIRYWSTKHCTTPLSHMESMMCSAATMAVLYNEDTTPFKRQKRLRNAALIVCLTESGQPARLITKYRPPSMVFVASTNEQTVRQANAFFGMAGIKLESVSIGSNDLAKLALKRLEAISDADVKSVKVIVVTGRDGGIADSDPIIRQEKLTKSGITKDAKSSGVVMVTPSGNPVAARGTRSLRSTNTSLALVASPLQHARNTHIICTMGPACWSEKMMNDMLDAGCDIIRLNFSHGDHEGHGETLQRFRKVCKAKQASMKSKSGLQTAPIWGTLLDTKGPEIRTSMLQEGKPILLEKGQSVVVEAVGDRYTSFEGFKTSKETRIGLSYAKLCTSVAPGDRILISDGTITIKVVKIISATELLGEVGNTKELGQRKNCNLPGVKVDLPVLTEKDINDLKEFACKHKVDYVAASFVQSAADVCFIRSVLDEAGGFDIKIISKIENQEGLNNFKEIIRETDGVMIARGDLGMEIPSSKVPLAQKLLTTECGLKGKFCVCATQMLESMIKNPRPTRAEMTDVANACIDGADCVMLSGETANGAFPIDSVKTMAAITQNSEQIVDHLRRFDFIRSQTPCPLDSAEGICSAAVQMAIDMEAKAILCFTSSGRAPQLVSKYRPPMPVFVVSEEHSIVATCRSRFGLHGIPMSYDELMPEEAVKGVIDYVNKMGIVDLKHGHQLVIVSRRSNEVGNVLNDQRLAARVHMVGNAPAIVKPFKSVSALEAVTYRSTKIGLDTIIDAEKYKHMVRKCKIVCTLGPQCSTEDMLVRLLDAGMNVARLNFSHGSHESHLEVLKAFRQATAARSSSAACLLDTKGPEIRTAMLKGGQPIMLVQGQEIIIEAVGDAYTIFEGYVHDTETRIGLSYEKLCQTVKPGGKILLADGTISIEVLEILSETELKGKVLNSKELGQRKNCNLPGVKVDLPVLMEKDINDLQHFAAKHEMDFVAASFVQTKEDVLEIRKVLDDAGGHNVRIISKIENQEGLKNFDSILEVTDGVMVARGDLGMEIPVEKVALAQKMLISAANLAGKTVIVATQMMESMIENQAPTTAECADIANAVFDGADACMLSGETANGKHPVTAVTIMASTLQRAEIGVNCNQTFNFVRTFTPKPVGTVEASVSTLAKCAVDIRPGMLVVFSENGKMARYAAKYRPCVPILVVTSNSSLARACSPIFACYSMLLPAPMRSKSDIFRAMKQSLKYGVEKGLCVPGKEIVVLASTAVATASTQGEKHFGAEREMFVTVAPGKLQFDKLGSLAPHLEGHSPQESFVAKTIALRATRMNLDMITRESKVERKTKIVGTVVPTTQPDTVKSLVQAGMDVLRINLAHSTTSSLDRVVSEYRSACAASNRVPCVLCELRGSELRSCWFIDKEMGTPCDSVNLHEGQEVTLVSHSDHGRDSFTGWVTESESRIGISLEKLGTIAGDAGTMIFMSDGNCRIRVTKGVSEEELRGVVTANCTLQSHAKVFIREHTTHMPFLTPQDVADLRWVVQNNVDFVAVSLTRKECDIEELRNILNKQHGNAVRILAKIEDHEGLINMEPILDAADGMIVSRGMLGLSLSPEQVSLAQNIMITRCNIRGKISIVSRHMLKSMCKNPRPTRAEMLDVANAVFESADALILGEETAKGNFPSESISTMDSILKNAEDATHYYALHSFSRDFSAKPFSTADAPPYCLARMANDSTLAAVVTFTSSGDAAETVCRYRPPVPQIVATTNKAMASAAALYFGMFSVLLPNGKLSVEDALKIVLDSAQERGCYISGDIGVLHGSGTLFADEDGVVSIVKV